MQHARFPEFSSSSECTSPATLILRRCRSCGSSTKYKNRCNVKVNVYWYNSAKHQIPTSFSSLNFSEIHTYALTSPIATYEFLYWLCFRRIYPKALRLPQLYTDGVAVGLSNQIYLPSIESLVTGMYQGTILQIKSYSRFHTWYRHVFRELFVFTILTVILLKLKMYLFKLQNSLVQGKTWKGERTK